MSALWRLRSQDFDSVRSPIVLVNDLNVSVLESTRRKHMIVRFMNQLWLVAATKEGGCTLVGLSVEEARRLAAKWRETALAECDA